MSYKYICMNIYRRPSNNTCMCEEHVHVLALACDVILLTAQRLLFTINDEFLIAAHSMVCVYVCLHAKYT